MGESQEQPRIQIDKETQEWLPNQDTILPIDGRDIPHFKEWVCWNGFADDPSTGRRHDGFDFAAYITDDGRIIFGLPPETPVRAIADGVVRQVQDNSQALHGEDMYSTEIDIEHGDLNSGMFSFYIHVVPAVKARTEVKKGDIIGTLYKDPEGDEGRLVHLHLGLTNSWNVSAVTSRLKDPRVLSEELYKHIAQPQGNASFTVGGILQSKIEVANFRSIRVNP